MPDEDIGFIRNSLWEWSKSNYRNYPWRETNVPYQILIAEIMLQRTKAGQVNQIYPNFLIKYPSFDRINNTSQSELLKDLESLGLYWRIKKIKILSKIIIEEFQGEIPRNRRDLINLPGVGQYISGAFLISAYQEKHALLDSNIVRFLSRYFGYVQTDNSRRNKEYLQKIEVILPKEFPRSFLYALLDFTFFICKHTKPRCLKCPLHQECRYEKY
jgi:A/G-specific adenine glycosylase